MNGAMIPRRIKLVPDRPHGWLALALYCCIMITSLIVEARRLVMARHRGGGKQRLGIVAPPSGPVSTVALY
jgi:hypothetical protein